MQLAPGVVALAGLLLAAADGALGAAELRVDCSRRAGEIRALHGVNNGPLDFGEVVDLRAHYRQAAFPLARLHDCQWPAGNVVDMHAVFPDPAADPNQPGSYRFAATDDYIQAIVDSGVGIVYRLGESIEWTRRKHHVAPPADPNRWAAACLGIIRHYNEGWAGGFRHGIRYWEIWNEPENRPQMWTGTDADYFRLYAAAARAIKKRFPDLTVGGPAVGAVGELADGRLKPTPFVQGFLDYCRREKLPLDFFSWHTYCDDPAVLVRRAAAVRKLLDDSGFPKAESHLNEWNYLPGNDWGPLFPPGQGAARRRMFEQIGGAPGAAFLACALIGLQDAPLDMANYYSGDTNLFGLFDRYGTARKTFHAMVAFRRLLDCPMRVEAAGGTPGRLTILAGLSRDAASAAVLVANFRADDKDLNLRIANIPWKGDVHWHVLAVDATHDLAPLRSGTAGPGQELQLRLPCEAPCVLLIRLSRVP